MNSMSDDHELCGWRVASEIALPELPRWSGDDRPADVTIAIGAMPARTDPNVVATPMVRIDAAKRAWVNVPDVADYLVEAGSRIVIAPRMAPDAPDIRLFLFGTVFGMLCHQRGVLPIHASVVEIDGRAVAFAGPSGAGKSTLAAAFLRAGYRILSDDVAPVEVHAAGMILPGIRRIRLWADSAEHADWPVQDEERCREGVEKFSRRLGGESGRSLAPAAIIHLRQRSSKLGGPRFHRLRGAVAAQELINQVYRWGALVGIEGRAAATLRATRVAGMFPRHFVMERPLKYEWLDDTIDGVVAAVRDGR